MTWSRALLVAPTVAGAALALLLPRAAHAVEDAGSLTPSFAEGDVIGVDDVEKLRRFLPVEFWDNRDFFFYEGMKLEIGPTQFDYEEAGVYGSASERFRGQPRIGPDNSLENFVAGRPFPMDEIDCASDLQAGVKLMWNFA
jgi:hypothetical protein